MTDEDRVRLHHMLDASRKAVALVSGISLEQYTAAESFGLRAATERFIEITGEAAHHVSDGLKAQLPEIPWRQIADMRNHLIHGYMTTSDRTVWNTAVKHVPRLVAQLEQLLGAP
ncbi:MAG: DUF86 domain-containing protein [Chloroflexi bacterium]|nr:DUF86 domain-containing protein [Chloroflexota bacterium]